MCIGRHRGIATGGGSEPVPPLANLGCPSVRTNGAPVQELRCAHRRKQAFKVATLRYVF